MKLKITRSEAIRELWARGDLRFKLRPVQYRIRDAWHKSRGFSKKFLGHISRQTGKSFFWTSVAIEECIKQPNFKVIYIAPVKEKLKDFITPIIEKILEDCPPAAKIELVGTNLCFGNGSVISFYGAVNESYQHIRGSAAGLVIIDEAGFVDNLEQLIGMIQPVLLRADGFLVLSSSSPVSGDHPFCEYIEKAQKEGWYFISTIDDDETVTDLQRETWAREMGGRDSTSFRREFLCEILTETERAIIPEWKDSYIQALKPTQFWPFYSCYLGMDI
jgi:hypothetical protein